MNATNISLPKTANNTLATAGRVLLGLYFIIPGIGKITGFQATAEYMADHGVILVPALLVLTIVIQLGGGAALVVGWNTRPAAFLLAALTLVISLVMHDFWTMPAGELQTSHETQNFIKNMAIMAGLLLLAGRGGGDWTFDCRRGVGTRTDVS